MYSGRLYMCVKILELKERIEHKESETDLEIVHSTIRLITLTLCSYSAQCCAKYSWNYFVKNICFAYRTNKCGDCAFISQHTHSGQLFFLLFLFLFLSPIQTDSFIYSFFCLATHEIRIHWIVCRFCSIYFWIK